MDAGATLATSTIIDNTAERRYCFIGGYMSLKNAQEALRSKVAEERKLFRQLTVIRAEIEDLERRLGGAGSVAALVSSGPRIVGTPMELSDILLGVVGSQIQEEVLESKNALLAIKRWKDEEKHKPTVRIHISGGKDEFWRALLERMDEGLGRRGVRWMISGRDILHNAQRNASQIGKIMSEVVSE